MMLFGGAISTVPPFSVMEWNKQETTGPTTMICADSTPLSVSTASRATGQIQVWAVVPSLTILPSLLRLTRSELSRGWHVAPGKV